MGPEDVPTSWADVPFPSQVREMQSFLDQAWVSPASVGINPCKREESRADKDLVQTSFGGSGLTYATAANTNVSIPTPISLSDCTFLEPRPSPSHSLHSRDPPYVGITEPTIQQGLGISIPSDLSYIQPGTLDFEQVRGPVLSHPVNGQSQIEGFRETIQQPGRTSARHVQTRSTPVRIAPNPAGPRRLEAHGRAGRDGQLTRRRPERQRSRRNNRSSQRDEEDRLVSELREQNVPWRDVADDVSTCDSYHLVSLSQTHNILPPG